MSEIFVAACIQQHNESSGEALDVGANRGIYTEMLLQKFSKVYAFEPHPENVIYLHQKFKLHPKLEIVPKAVSNVTGKTLLQINPHNYGGHTLSSKVAAHPEWGFTEKKEIEIETVTLDEFCEGKNIQFMKVDIEGAEDFIFEGATKTLSKPDLNIVIEVHKEVDLNKLFKFFKSFDFRIYGLGLVIGGGSNRYETVEVDCFDADHHYLLAK